MFVVVLVIPVPMKYDLAVNEPFAVNVGSLVDCCKYIDRMHPWQLYRVVLTLALNVMGIVHLL
jgi:hypothetical protein